MTQLTLPQAAKATGKDRTTLYRAIKSGKLTASKNANGDYQVDVSELERVYSVKVPRNQPATLHEVASQRDATAENLNSNNDLVAEVAVLRAQIAALEADKRALAEDKADLREERDNWRKAYEDQAATVKLLTDQRETSTPKVGLFKRLFGG